MVVKTATCRLTWKLRKEGFVVPAAAVPLIGSRRRRAGPVTCMVSGVTVLYSWCSVFHSFLTEHVVFL